MLQGFLSGLEALRHLILALLGGPVVVVRQTTSHLGLPSDGAMNRPDLPLLLQRDWVPFHIKNYKREGAGSIFSLENFEGALIA